MLSEKSKNFGPKKEKQPKSQQAKSEQAKSKVSQIRATQIKATQIRVTKISSNHLELHGAIFLSAAMADEWFSPVSPVYVCVQRVGGAEEVQVALGWCSTWKSSLLVEFLTKQICRLCAVWITFSLLLIPAVWCIPTPVLWLNKKRSCRQLWRMKETLRATSLRHPRVCPKSKTRIKTTRVCKNTKRLCLVRQLTPS